LWLFIKECWTLLFLTVVYVLHLVNGKSERGKIVQLQNAYFPQQFHKSKAVFELLILEVGCWGTRWRSGWGTALQTGRSQDRFPMVLLEFFIDKILPAAFWPCGRLSL
jgi:hypothetical protein